MSEIIKPKLNPELLKNIRANGRVKSNEEKKIDGKAVRLHRVSARNVDLGAFEIYVVQRPPRFTGNWTEIELVDPWLLSEPKVNTSRERMGDGSIRTNNVGYFERSICAESVIVKNKNEEGVK